MRLKTFSIILFLLAVCSVNCFNQQITERQIPTSVNRDKSEWTAEVTNIGENNKIQFLYTVADNFLIGIPAETANYSLYKSINEGASWEKLTVVPDYSLTSISFFNPSEGVALAIKANQSSNSSASTQFILRTEDGGANWQIVYDISPNVQLAFLQSDKDQTSVILGQKCVVNCSPDKISYYTNFLLISQDKGRKWTDVSDGLNSFLKNSAKSGNEIFQSIIIAADKSIIGVSDQNKFYKTADFGSDWKEIKSISYNVPPTILTTKFGELPNNQLWATGSSMSIEGRLAKISISENNDLWKTFILNDYYFSDVEFLSTNEVIAIGYKYLSPANNKDKSRTGVVLSSEDGGKNWSVVYELPDSQQINLNSIIKLSNRKLIVSGDKIKLIVSK